MKTPHYIYIVNDIKSRIESGEFRPGDQLPSEEQLCVEYSVSKATMRQAKNLLNQKGIIVSEWRKGSYVAEPAGDTFTIDYDIMNSFDDPIDNVDTYSVEMAYVDLPFNDNITEHHALKITRILSVFGEKVGCDIKYIVVKGELGIPTKEAELNVFVDRYLSNLLLFSTDSSIEITCMETDEKLHKIIGVGVGAPITAVVQYFYDRYKKIYAVSESYLWNAKIEGSANFF